MIYAYPSPSVLGRNSGEEQLELTYFVIGPAGRVQGEHCFSADETGVCRMFSIKVVIRYLDQAPGSEGWILNSKYEGIYGVMVTKEAPGWRGDLSCVAWDYELFSGGMVSRWGTRGRDPW